MTEKRLGQKRNPVLENLPVSSFGLPPQAQAHQPAAGSAPAPHLHGGGGLRGQLPLPVGTPMRIDANQLTPLERQQLEQLGWKEGQPIPDNLADLVDAAKSAVQSTDPSQLLPPGDPNTPPLQLPKEISIEELSPEHRRQIQQVIADAAEQLKQPANPGPTVPGGPGVREAAQNITHRQIQLEDDRHERPVPEEKPEQPGTANLGPRHCPHCDWDLAVADTIEVTDDDKYAFLMSSLGGQPFQKIYQLLNGRLTVTLRQLRVDEVDACYRQVYHDRQLNRFEAMADFVEWVRRYRLCLELVDFRSSENLVAFPESLAGWQHDVPEGEPTKLPAILQEVQQEVLKTESLYRMVGILAGKFNRLVAKLEANVENSDFYNVTGGLT